MWEIRKYEDLKIMSTFVFMSLLEQLNCDIIHRNKEGLEGITLSVICMCAFV